MTTQALLSVPVFVSSPGDLSEERQLVKSIIMDLNEHPFIRGKYHLDPLLYEERVPFAVGKIPQMVVEDYITPSKDCYLVICMFWNRMGTPFDHQGKRYDSGTYYEFETAYEATRQTGKPNLLIYRKQTESENFDPLQKAQVDNFFTKIFQNQGFSGLVGTFKTSDEFKKLLRDNIVQVLANDIPKPPDVKNGLHTQLPTTSQTNNYGSGEIIQTGGGDYARGDIFKPSGDVHVYRGDNPVVKSLELQNKTLDKEAGEEAQRLKRAKDDLLSLKNRYKNTEQQRQGQFLVGIAAIAIGVLIALAQSMLLGGLIAVGALIVTLTLRNQVSSQYQTKLQAGEEKVKAAEDACRKITDQKASNEAEIHRLLNQPRSN